MRHQELFSNPHTPIFFTKVEGHEELGDWENWGDESKKGD